MYIMHVIWTSNGAEKNKYKNIACKIILYMHEMFSTSLKKKTPKCIFLNGMKRLVILPAIETPFNAFFVIVIL